MRHIIDTLQYRITSIELCLFNDIIICKKQIEGSINVLQYILGMPNGPADCRMAGCEFKESAKYYLKGEEFLGAWRIFRRMQNIIWKTALNGNKATPPCKWSVFLCNITSCNCTEKVQLPAHWSGGSSKSLPDGHHAIELDVIMQRIKIFWLCGAKRSFDYAKIIARTHRKLEASNDN